MARTRWRATATQTAAGPGARARATSRPGTVPQARKGTCVGHLGTGVSVPAGCQTVADLGPCNANLTGAVQPPPPPNNTPPSPPTLLDVQPR